MSTPSEARFSRPAQSRRVVASYESYPEAEAAVERLSREGFPVERVAIVGRDMHLYEQVTGRVTWADAALRGALAGAVTGALVGWLFGVFDWFHPLVAAAWLAFDGLWFGALVGTIMGLIAHWITRGRRDFGSIQTMVADQYDLLVDDQVAEEAARVLGVPTGAHIRPSDTTGAPSQPSTPSAPSGTTG
jgi:hypothetical protein